MAPRLPPELIGRIIEEVASSLLGKEDATYRTRAVVLKHLCRVNSTFRAFAQTELKRHVIVSLDKQKSVERVMSAFARDDGLLGSTESIEFLFSMSSQTKHWARQPDTEELLERIGMNVEKVAMRGNIIHSWHFALLRLLPNLRQVHLAGVDVNPIELPDSFSFSNISHLTIDLSDYWIFQWSNLPHFSSNLTHVTLLHGEADSSTFDEYWSRIAPHITHLHLEDVLSFRDSYLSDCTNLLHLHATRQPYLSLSTLNSPLKTLTMEMEPMFAGPLRETLIDPDWLPSTSLQRIELSRLKLGYESQAEYQEWMESFKVVYEPKEIFYTVGWDLRRDEGTGRRP